MKTRDTAFELDYFALPYAPPPPRQDWPQDGLLILSPSLNAEDQAFLDKIIAALSPEWQEKTLYLLEKQPAKYSDYQNLSPCKYHLYLNWTPAQLGYHFLIPQQSLWLGQQAPFSLWFPYSLAKIREDLNLKRNLWLILKNL